jgi:hypothetical protein
MQCTLNARGVADAYAILTVTQIFGSWPLKMAYSFQCRISFGDYLE